MASLTRVEFERIAKKLKGAYTYATFLRDKESMETWYYALCNYPVEHINTAIANYINEHTNAPTPADIREYIDKVAREGRKFDTTKWKLWRILDLNSGEVENEVYADEQWSSDNVADWLKTRGVHLNGLVLKPAKENA